MIQKFDGEFPVSHLRFEIGETYGKDALAETKFPEDYVITIVFNEDELDLPELDLAGTIVHETIHAEIFRKLLSLSNRSGEIDRSRLRQMLQRGDFPGLLDYYTRYGEQNFQHEQMAAHYIAAITDMLKEFDNNQHPQELYKAIAWEGLMGDGTLDNNTGLYPNSTQAWIDLGREERLRILEIIRNFLINYHNGLED